MEMNREDQVNSIQMNKSGLQLIGMTICLDSYKYRKVVNLYICQAPAQLQLTLLLQCFNWWTVRVILHIAVVKHFVIGRQAAVPQFI